MLIFIAPAARRRPAPAAPAGLLVLKTTLQYSVTKNTNQYNNLTCFTDRPKKYHLFHLLSFYLIGLWRRRVCSSQLLHLLLLLHGRWRRLSSHRGRGQHLLLQSCSSHGRRRHRGGGRDRGGTRRGSESLERKRNSLFVEIQSSKTIQLR